MGKLIGKVEGTDHAELSRLSLPHTAGCCIATPTGCARMQRLERRGFLERSGREEPACGRGKNFGATVSGAKTCP